MLGERRREDEKEHRPEQRREFADRVGGTRTMEDKAIPKEDARQRQRRRVERRVSMKDEDSRDKRRARALEGYELGNKRQANRTGG